MSHTRRMVFVTCSVLSVCAAAKGLTAKQLFAKVSPAVVKVYQYDPLGKRFGVGSGFVIKPTGMVVTNYHVIESAISTDNLRVEVGGQLRRVQGMYNFMPKHDLALLAVEMKRGERLAFLTLAAKMPPQGEKAYTVGYPLGLPKATIADGLINGLQKLEDLALLQTSAPISEGSSGGPLLISDGTVVGVTTLTLVEGQNLNFAVPAEHVRTLLKGAGKLRKEIPRLIRPEMLAALPATDRPVNVMAKVDLADCTVPMTLRRLYAGMAQPYVIMGVARPGLSKEQRKPLFDRYVQLLCKQKLPARHVTCGVQVVRMTEGQDRTRQILYIRRNVVANNAAGQGAAYQKRLSDAKRFSVLVVCKSPYWPGTFCAYLDKADAAKLAKRPANTPVVISGFISQWVAFPGEKLGLSVTLDGCVVEAAARRAAR